jgi:hypothetical protein
MYQLVAETFLWLCKMGNINLSCKKNFPQWVGGFLQIIKNCEKYNFSEIISLNLAKNAISDLKSSGPLKKLYNRSSSYSCLGLSIFVKERN